METINISDPFEVEDFRLLIGLAVVIVSIKHQGFKNTDIEDCKAFIMSSINLLMSNGEYQSVLPLLETIVGTRNINFEKAFIDDCLKAVRSYV